MIRVHSLMRTIVKDIQSWDHERMGRKEFKQLICGKYNIPDKMFKSVEFDLYSMGLIDIKNSKYTVVKPKGE